MAVAAGLDHAEVTEVLGGDRFAAEVRADEDRARAFAISGVPFFVLDRRYGVSGAQPTEVLLGALREAWGALAQLAPVGPAGSTDDGAGHEHDDVCADGSCAIRS